MQCITIAKSPLGKLHYLLSTATWQKNITEEKKCRAQKIQCFWSKMPFRPLRKRNSGNFRIFFAPPPKKNSKIFLLLFYIFQDILRLSKNKFRVESLKTRREFLSPPLRGLEDLLRPPREVSPPPIS